MKSEKKRGRSVSHSPSRKRSSSVVVSEKLPASIVKTMKPKRIATPKQLANLAKGRAIMMARRRGEVVGPVSIQRTVEKRYKGYQRQGGKGGGLASQIAAALIAPDIAPAVRLKTTFSDIETAVAHMFSRGTFLTPAGYIVNPNQGNEQVNISQSFVMIGKQFLRAAIIYIPQQTTGTWGYIWKKNFLPKPNTNPYIQLNLPPHWRCCRCNH